MVSSAVTRLLIVRHGNTFDPGQTPLRVGVRTDLPLSTSGQAQARALANYLHVLSVDMIYCSELQRTYQTAELARADRELTIQTMAQFNEIDYGVDEGKTEAEVIARIGEAALQAWNDAGVPPPGWHVDPQKIIHNWQAFAEQISQSRQTILVVTSNGIARFAPYLLGDIAAFPYPLKMATGAVSSLVYQANQWQLEYWNMRPKHLFKNQ